MAYRLRSFLIARVVFDSQFLMRWASSRTIRSGCQAFSSSRSLTTCFYGIPDSTNATASRLNSSV